MAFQRVRRLGRAGLWLIAMGLVVALASSLSWHFSIGRLTDRAGSLDAVDLALGSAAVTHTAANQAVVISASYANGFATAEALADALAEVTANTVAFEQLAAEIGGTNDAASEYADLASATSSVVGLIGEGDVVQARLVVESAVESAFRRVVDHLVAERLNIIAELNSASALSSRLEQSLRLAGVLAIPLVAAALVSARARRRIRVERAGFLDMLDAVGERSSGGDDLLLAASHRLRTPLTSLYGLSEVLAHSNKIGGLERELASLVHSEASDLCRIADDVLIVSQDRAGTLERAVEIFAMADVVDDAVSPVKAAGVEVKIDCPEVWVLSDPAKVRQIVRNIVANAAQHGAEPIFVEVSEEDGIVECVIVDHGDGLPDSVVPGEGIFAEDGVGLSVAYVLSELIGSQLTYERDHDLTRFSLSFSREIEDAPLDHNLGT